MENYVIEIIIAIISMIGTASGAYFANKKSTALVAYRLEQLEKKQDVHNQVIDRVSVRKACGTKFRGYQSSKSQD